MDVETVESLGDPLIVRHVQHNARFVVLKYPQMDCSCRSGRRGVNGVMHQAMYHASMIGTFHNIQILIYSLKGRVK